MQENASSLISPPRGRLAPSPTGFLHLGNAWAFMLAWLAAHSEGGSLVLRMEDIDPARALAQYEEAILEDLRWLGITWDEGPDIGGSHAPYTQSQRTSLYLAALGELGRQKLLYPCFCTRRELRELAGAPHIGDAGVMYSGHCRELTPSQWRELRQQGRRAALRMRVAAEEVHFADRIYGETMYLR